MGRDDTEANQAVLRTNVSVGSGRYPVRVINVVQALLWVACGVGIGTVFRLIRAYLVAGFPNSVAERISTPHQFLAG